MPHQCTTCGHTFADGSKDMLGGCPDCGGNKFQFYPPGTDVPDEPPSNAADEAPEPDPDPSGAASTVGRAATKVRDFVSKEPSAGDTVSSRDRSTSERSDGTPDPNAPWPDSSDAADPIRKGGFKEEEQAPSPGPADGVDEDGSADGVDEDGIIDADARAARDAVDDVEDFAQSDARSGLASDAEVEAAGDGDAAAAGAADATAADATAADATTADAEAADTSGDLEAAEASVDRNDDPAGTPDGRVVSEPTGEEPDLSELREQLNDQFESIKILEPGQYELNLMELYDREEYIIALQENGRYVIQVPENWMGDRPGE